MLRNVKEIDNGQLAIGKCFWRSLVFSLFEEQGI